MEGRHRSIKSSDKVGNDDRVPGFPFRDTDLGYGRRMGAGVSRTPEERLVGLPDFPFEARYEEVGGLRLAYVDEGEGPEHEFMTYVPSTWPGVRLPHVWLKDHTAVQDHIGYGDHYTLLRLDGRADAAGFDTAFAKVGAPFKLLTFDDPHAREVYGTDIMLLRPDMHIAWRGTAAPADAGKLARMAAGY